MKSLILPFTLLPLAAAHFELNYPPSRGTDHENQAEFPCGGLSPSTNRTRVSLSSPSFPIVLDMGHDQTAVQFLLGVGTNPGSNYNISLRKTFRVEGLGQFCVPEIELDEGLLGRELEDGLNLTLQVVNNGHPSGGLYACADLQLTADTIPSDDISCSNNTGITAIPFEGAAADRNANASTPDGEAQGSGDDHGHDHNEDSTDSADGDSPTLTDVAVINSVAWSVLGAAVLGGLVVF
ncbi:hypothetical protein BDV18DRAFT_160736 [Aspergillus unguis]